MPSLVAVTAGALAAGTPADTVTNGPLFVAVLLAIAAGAVSFASPCVVPLVPGYLSYLVGLVGAEATDTGEGPRGGGGLRVRTRAVVATAWFVAGFTVVFLLESLLVLGVATTLVTNQQVLTRIGGVITVLLGLAMLGFLRPLQTERRLHLRPAGRLLGPVLLGGVFALGWTVCIGPTLGGVLSMAWSTDWNGNAWRGLFLVIAYCAGLGIPFLLVALGFGWATTALGFLRRHTRAIQVIGSVMLILVGLAMVIGWWSEFLAWLQFRLAEAGEVPLL